MIEKTHANQNDLNIELLNFVNRRGSASYADLFAAFGDGDEDVEASKKRFSKKMEYLVFIEHLQGMGKGANRTFAIGPLAGKRQPSATLGARITVLADSYLKYSGPVVPPRQFDVMHAPPYVPGPGPSLRPGSLAFKDCLSVGNRC